MQKRRLILSDPLLEVVIKRLCQELIEQSYDLSQVVLLGLQPRGRYFADRIKNVLQTSFNIDLPLGYLDATFYRDDFNRGGHLLKPNSTQIEFLIENKVVILIDDVLATGRMVRAAIDAMQAFGRPERIMLMTLINRTYNRQLPIQPDFVGKVVNTIDSQKVLVEWQEQGHSKDSIWLID
jgi:pyrimidine operon attenuation protein / uracil phosphoribosyltransferase